MSTHLRFRLLAAIGSAAGLVGLSSQGCGGSSEPTQVYSDGGKPISVPAGSCSNQTEVECYAPSSLPRRNMGNVPRDPDAAPPPPEPPVARDANGCVDKSEVQDGCCNTAVEGPVFDGVACCYRFCTGACCGRPLVVEGRARVAPAASRSDWCALPGPQIDPGALDDATRAALAQAWLEDARMEHASIASFARFTLDLLALGAPPDLVLGSQRAAVDEVEHARLTFGLASRLADEALGPGPLELAGAQPSPSLAAAAAAAVREGCVGETLAALLAEDQRARAKDEPTCHALDVLAQDEAAHAELAWRFVAWALRKGGAEVRAAVERAFADGLAAVPLPAAPDAAVDVAAWTSFGRATADQARAAATAALRDVIEPCARALLA